jgi:hypothetical protein
LIRSKEGESKDSRISPKREGDSEHEEEDEEFKTLAEEAFRIYERKLAEGARIHAESELFSNVKKWLNNNFAESDRPKTHA